MTMVAMPRPLLRPGRPAPATRRAALPWAVGAADSPAAPPTLAPEPLLFLVADTGGGHRSAARAVADALERAYPGRFAPVLLDPLGGPGSSWLLRRITRLYGPVIRRAPWAWAAVYHASDSGRVMRLLRRTLLRLADRPVIDAATALRPAALVSFHPLATAAAVSGAGVWRTAGPGTAVTADRPGAAGPRHVPAVTVVTDLVSAHAAWRDGRADRIVTPSARVAWRCRLDGIGADRCMDLGLPVAPQFWGGPLPRPARDALRRALGVDKRRFAVVVTGGGEGSGGVARRVSALTEAFDDIDVIAICGRNRRLQRELARLVPRTGGRLRVEGFVGNMADWLRCADVVVTKAGPGTIAEATCCGAPLIVSSSVPGQEDGNADVVVTAGAGRYAPGPADVVREICRLRRAPAALEAMRAASARLGRPGAAPAIAALLAGLIEASAPAPPARRLARVAAGSSDEPDRAGLAANMGGSEMEGRRAAWTEEHPREPKGRRSVWTEERGTSDEGRRCTPGAPEASGKIGTSDEGRRRPKAPRKRAEDTA
jgi:1,2-diacylglycerol 3-beta-galactosyltransferase